MAIMSFNYGTCIRDSFSIIEKYHPDFRRLIFKTGDTICDWVVPQEWRLNNCFIQHIDSGRRYCTLSTSNLSVVGYSVPVDTVLPLSELQEYIYTEPTLPHAIPYITSYYKKQWGFCMTQIEKIPFRLVYIVLSLILLIHWGNFT